MITGCHAEHVSAAASGLPNGPESQPSEPPTSFPAGLLVVRYPGDLSHEQSERLSARLIPVAQALNLNAMLLDNGADAHIQTDNKALIAALSTQAAAIGAQVEAINRLAASNEALVQAMAEAEGDDQEPGASGTYMDGSKR